MSLSLFKSGVLQKTLAVGEAASPPPRRRWLLIGGTFTHVNLTDTTLLADNKGNAGAAGGQFFYKSRLASATASNIYNIFNTVADGMTPSSMPWLITANMELLLYTGGTGANVTLLLLEFDDQ